MKKLSFCIWLLTITAVPFKVATADEVKLMADESVVQAYISAVYKSLDFSKVDRLSYDVFTKAYRGYLNLRNAGKINLTKDILTICDFDLPSTEPRLWVIDLSERKVLYNTLVAHGQGSGEVCADCFSNQSESHQTSLGFYVTAETYLGDHGFSLKLDGMDYGFNDAARLRGIVVHGADYVSEQFIEGNQRLGRSWGCPAIPEALKTKMIDKMKEGTCLYISHNDRRYEKSSYWLNKKLEHLPLQEYSPLTSIKAKKNHKLIIEYRRGYTIDSTVEMEMPIIPSVKQ